MSKAENYESNILNEIFDEVTPSELKKVEKRMLLAQKISEGIKAKGWKKIDIARALNKYPSEITKWLSGTHKFNSDTLFDIEEILGIDLITTQQLNNQQVVTFNISVSQKRTISKTNSSEIWSGNKLNHSMHSSISLSSFSQGSSTNYEYQA